jgi:hypothetical protein
MTTTSFPGRVEIESDALHTVLVTIDGNEARIQAGVQPGISDKPPGSPSSIANGVLSLTNTVGVECVSISASNTGGLLVENYADGTPCLALGQMFEGDPGPSLHMLNHGNANVRLHGLTGALLLGGKTSTGPGVDGHISVSARDNASSIGLETSAGNARVRIGGISVLGEPVTQSELAIFSNLSLNSDSHNAAISIRSTDADASIRAGGNLGHVSGVDGRILVLDKFGKATIQLEGATGDIVLSNADCAEDFDLAAAVQATAGTVMVLDAEGMLLPCSEAYDPKVAGVISGAGEHRPGIVLDRRESSGNRVSVALLGKVFCKVDASTSSIAVGDLLTTSDVCGHAMKANDRDRAFGAVLGKALRPLANGRGLIPVLVALQ